MVKQAKELSDKLNELRRWHNSKSNILQIKIKENIKVIEELESKNAQLVKSLKFKDKQAGEKGDAAERLEIKVSMAKIKETLPIIIEDPPKEINSAILDISPTA